MPLLHFNYRTNVGSNWINSLQTAILSSSDADLRDRNKLWAKSQLGDLGLSISTKMAMTAVAGARIREHLQHLATNIAGRQSEFQECLQNEIAFDAGDFPFQFMTDLDGFVFECDSLPGCNEEVYSAVLSDDLRTETRQGGRQKCYSGT